MRGRGESAGVRPVHAGEGGREQRGVCWLRPVHAGEGEGGERESVGDETCPCGGGRTWGEGSLLAMRPVHAGEASVGRGILLAMRPVPCRGGRVWGEGVCWR